MKGYLFIGLVLLSLTGAEAVDLDVQWECPQSQQGLGTGLARSRSFRLSYEPARSAEVHVDDTYTAAVPATIDWSSFRTFADSARTSGVDYFSCIDRFRRELMRGIATHCRTIPGNTVQDCIEEMKAATNPLLDFQSEVGAAALSRNAVPPLVPMDDVRPTAGTAAYDALDARFSNTSCDYADSSPEGYGQYALTESYLVERLPGVVSSMPAACKPHLLRTFLDDLARLQPPPGRCPSAVTRDPVCFRFRGGTSMAVARLRALFPEQFAFLGSVTDTNLARCILRSPDAATVLRSFSAEVLSSVQCTRLAANGDSTIVNLDDVGSRTEGRYRLTRVSGNSYLAELNLQITPAGKKKAYLKAARRCLKDKANPLFNDPDGRRLEIALTDSGTPPPPEHPIQIQGHDYRSDSGNWEGDIDCPTITHDRI